MMNSANYVDEKGSQFSQRCLNTNRIISGLLSSFASKLNPCNHQVPRLDDLELGTFPVHQESCKSEHFVTVNT